ncbi:Cu(I)-responsive transcriptional regulator [Pseudorhodobacter sp.]|uniref:Cu(I)-responsive transcriptional regulator n=1 Tax=Pseudorhodobacter sp. TaxID=1934400 RepID=UPI002AFF8060|nr:Cu(I)-responsive transcriptional regulator [Pseudorhodobacter sp.]
MNIKEAGKLAGLPAKTIRYYEEVGLVRPLRDSNGYRAFRENDVHKLGFLARARALGFTIEDCRVLLSLYEDKSRASADVKEIAERHLTQISDKIAALQMMHETLSHLVTCCHGDDRPDCPILADLAPSK